MGNVLAWIIVSLIALWVIAIFVYDAHRRKKGAPSIFVDACESEGRGKRLLRDYRKAYNKKK